MEISPKLKNEFKKLLSSDRDHQSISGNVINPSASNDYSDEFDSNVELDEVFDLSVRSEDKGLTPEERRKYGHELVNRITAIVSPSNREESTKK